MFSERNRKTAEPCACRRATARTTAVLLLLVSGMCAGLAAEGGQHAACDTHDWFTLQRQYGQLPPLCQGLVDGAFDRRALALKRLHTVIRDQPRGENAFEAHQQLLLIYFRGGEYRKALQQADAALSVKPGARDVAEVRDLLAVLSEAPDMVVSRMKREPNPSHVPPRAGFYLPVDIEGQPSLYIADTGANVSVISAAEARSLGLNVRSGSAAMTDISGAAVKVQVATATEMDIGNFHFSHVAFLVMPETQPPFNELPVNEQVILGLPVLRGLKSVRMNAQGVLEAGSLRGKAYKQVQLAYDDLYMVLPASVEGHSLVYTLDTGAEHSTLNPPFANAYPQLLAAGRKKQHTLTGMGGSSNQNSVELDQLRLSLGNTEVVMKPAIVLLHETSTTSGWAAGNLGDDLLNQAKPFAIDFEKMAFVVAR